MDTSSILLTFAATSFALLNPLGTLPIFIGYSQIAGEGTALACAARVIDRHGPDLAVPADR